MSKHYEIQKLLDEALAYDQAAIAKRRSVGRQLQQLQTEYPYHWLRLSGLDVTTADKLMRMARG